MKRSEGNAGLMVARPLVPWVLAWLVVILAGCASQPGTQTASPGAQAKGPLYTALDESQKKSLEQARQALAAGQPEKSLALLGDLRASGAEHPDVLANTGIVHAQLGQTDQARKAFREALELAPGHPVAANNLALLEQRAGHFRKARDLLQKAVEAHPGEPKLHYNLAVLCELYLMELEKALAHYKRYQALLDEPDSRVAGWIKDLERRVN